MHNENESTMYEQAWTDDDDDDFPKCEYGYIFKENHMSQTS